MEQPTFRKKAEEPYKIIPYEERLKETTRNMKIAINQFEKAAGERMRKAIIDRIWKLELLPQTDKEYVTETIMGVHVEYDE